MALLFPQGRGAGNGISFAFAKFTLFTVVKDIDFTWLILIAFFFLCPNNMNTLARCLFALSQVELLVIQN